MNATDATQVDPRWEAVRTRDAARDGGFYYSVATTGVYCRPSCAARLPNRANVRFHETTAAAEAAGFRPCKRCKPDVAPDTIEYATGNSSLGGLLVARSRSGLCALFIDDDLEALRAELQSRFPKARLVEGGADTRALFVQIAALIDMPTAPMELELDLRGTDFQRAVWQGLREIPVGKTVTYSELAQSLGMPKAVRAVGRACGANHVAVVVPCHRVVGRDGSLTGFRWGVERKRALLEREKAA